MAKRGVRRLGEERYSVGVSARRGDSAGKRGEKAAAVEVERGDRACGTVAGGRPAGKVEGFARGSWSEITMYRP